MLLLGPVFAAAHPQVTRVENGGLLFTDNPAGVSGTDAGYSIPVGRQTLWLFGDVFLLDPIAPAKPYVGGVSNCGLLLPAGEGTKPLSHYRFLTDARGLARQLIPNEAGEGSTTRLWPGGSWYDAANRRLWLFYGNIQTTGKGPYDFRAVGTGLAVADTRNPNKIAFRRLHNDGGEFWWPNDGGPSFGQGVLDGHDGWLYVYGQMPEPDKGAALCRVRSKLIDKPAAYEYFTGGLGAAAWSPKRTDARAVEGLKDFPSELSVSYNRYLGDYLAVHSVMLDDRIRLSLAPKPWGPFRTVGDIGAPRTFMANNPCYAGKEHPELAEDGGRVIYVTYVDQKRYWLQLEKVTLQR